MQKNLIVQIKIFRDKLKIFSGELNSTIEFNESLSSMWLNFFKLFILVDALGFHKINRWDLFNSPG